ncbi:PD-(D/E)XK nuclease family protein [uncultured Helicobacter sp.]|uniref:PD-(D/E)XK nuclease family protein n=1 Tax=uncultured Helicobacter sp. TaxID=175537 RepID=UPI00261C2176|nr:PD-(D/E)XK nuclease family protein [uncultured Helicobacter sp.]
MAGESCLKVYSSHRSLVQHLNEGELLSPHIMMGEFFTQLVIVDGYRALPQAMRLPLSMSVLKECAKELERVKFIFEQSFLAFLESSQFLFGFFDELTQAQVSIDEIPLLDTYGDYEDHLRVLKWVENRYKQRLEELKYYDGLILPPQAHIRINESYVRHFSHIDIYIEGIVSKAHLALLSQVAQMTTLRLHFWLDNFNITLPFFTQMKDCKPFHRYMLNPATNEILESAPINRPMCVSTYHFSLRISQVALVFYKIEEWLRNGVNAEEIAVIVPDEHFVSYLALFDKAYNLNFAMGKDITRTQAYKCLENMLGVYEADMQTYPYRQICEMIEANLISLDDRGSKKLRQSLSELLFIWENAGFADCRYKEILELLLEELKKCSIDDVMGGKIRVMGVLESRGFTCKKAIIVDFNEGVIPNVAQDDLFLNSMLRQRLGMPTMRDKEQLQKHYYYGIFSSADEVVVSYVENEDKHKSLLLEELEQYTHITSNDGDKRFALLPHGGKYEYCEDEIMGKIPRFFTPSKLKTLLECPRRYFYQYEESLCKVQEESNVAFMGNVAHQCLESVYRQYIGKKVQLNAKEIYANILTHFKAQYASMSALDGINTQLLAYEIEAFLKQYEDKREVEILYLEEKMKAHYGVFDFSVCADRIQKIGERIEIIDYKYRQNFKVEKNAEKTSDFALILYAEAFKQNNPQYASLPITMCYWDIKGCKIVEEESVEEKNEKLLEHLKIFQDEINFHKCENKQHCHYCDFTDLCDR